MTDFDRNTMIERYMAGQMGASEKKEFLSRVERDEELRRALYAETLINRAIHSDRSSVAGQPADSRARFLTMLAVVAPEAAIPTMGSGGGGGTSAAGKVAGMGKFIGSGVAKVIIAAVVGITATVGTILIVPKLSNGSTSAASVTAPAIKQSPVPAPATETVEQPNAPATTGNQNQSQSTLPAEIQAPQVESGRNVTNVEMRESSPEMHSSVSQPREKERVKTAETAKGAKKNNDVLILNDQTDGKIHLNDAKVSKMK
ncbi:MAG: hypothetical protein ABIR47_16720 [Candidatus Kapaibacterium sp.]